MLVADDVALPAGPAMASRSARGRGDAEAVLVPDVSPGAEASGHALGGTRFGRLLAAHSGTSRAAAAELFVALALATFTSGGAALVTGHAGTVPSGSDQAWLAVTLGPADAFVETSLWGATRSSGAAARHQVTLSAGGFAVGVALGVPHLGPGVARKRTFELLSGGQVADEGHQGKGQELGQRGGSHDDAPTNRQAGKRDLREESMPTE